MFQFADLRDQLALYLMEAEVEQIFRAYLLALTAHEGQKRSTGDPYISHPIEVARILANMQMDYECIIGAILHDVLEDTPVQKEEIKAQFGEKVADLVDGVSKLDKITFETKIEAQANNLRKMMLAMSNDIRVILIKLADRLHNMRTLSALPRDKQRRIALETLEIYAPIAHRLGINKFRTEFEDLGFSYLYPMRYKVLKDAVRVARGNKKRLLEEIEHNLQDKLKTEQINKFAVCGREKHLYSLYKKMRKKALSVSQVMDIYAIRIITDDIGNCYRILGIVHSIYKPVAGRFKDYIAIPKSNGYQSLHSVVFGPFGVPIEVQIRTESMNQVAENGIAAHWLYKESHEDISEAEIKASKWLKGLLDTQKGIGNSKEFLENIKFDLYTDEVYVFTPTGDIWSLHSGSTVVDFAYAVHTDLGNSCVAAKIDRRLVPLSTKLKSGQTVEIITAKEAHPNPTWLSFLVTGKAKSSVRHWLKNQKVSDAINLGRRLLEMALSTISLSLDNITQEQFTKVLKELKLKTQDKLFEALGLGKQLAPIIARKLITELPDITERTTQHLPHLPLAIQGTEGMIVSYGKCCFAVPGDPIIGFLSSGRGIVIHRESCTHLKDISSDPEKYIFITWADNIAGLFNTELKVDVINQQGTLALVAKTISESFANIDNVHVDERDPRHNSLVFLLQVKNRAHLARVMQKLRKCDVITKVSRVK